MRLLITLRGGQRFNQIGLCNWHGADFAHYHASGDVGELQGFKRRKFVQQTSGQRGNHGVAGARNVEYFLRGGGQMVRAFIQQRNAFLATRDGQKIQI